MPPQFPSPKNVLRIMITVCLVGAFLSALASLPRPGPFSVHEVRLRELSGWLFTAMFAFLLLYLEHAWVKRVMKRELDRTLGYVESLGCVAIVLSGSLSLLYAAATEGRLLLPDSVHGHLLLVLCVYGEATFIVNAAWSYLHPQKAPRISAQQRMVIAAHVPAPIRDNDDWQRWLNFFRWPQSAARAFAVTAALFAAIGLTLIVCRPLWLLPIALYDHIGVVPAGAVFTVAAVPFVVFAALYRIAETHYHSQFQPSSTRLHMVCGLLNTLEVLRVYTVWAISNSGTVAAPLTFDDLNGVLALGFLTMIVFVWNLARSSPPGQAGQHREEARAL